MRLVIQRVSEASVSINGSVHASIGRGLVVLVGVEAGDSEDDVRWLAAKTVAMRIFPDDDGVMNLSLADVGGEILAISQFTLTASTRKGNRPSYIRAAGHELAVPLYEMYCGLTREALIAASAPEKGRNDGGGCAGSDPVKQGVFGADMQVALINDGPVTIVIDSRLRE